MSFDINWESIASDNNISDQLLEFLNDKLGSLELPEYLNGLQVVKFSLGERSPEITIKDVDFPFPEFYSESDGAHSKQQNDYQNSAMQRRQGLHQKTAPLSPTKQSISSRYPQTNFEMSRSPSPIPQGLNRSTTPTQVATILPTVSLPPPVTPGIMSSPISSRTSLLMPRSNSSYFQGMNNGVGLGIGGFGLKETTGGSNLANTDYSAEYHSTPMAQNVSIDGVYSGVGRSDLTKSLQQQIIEEDETSHSETESDSEKSSDSDLQLTVDLKFDSKIYIEVICNLLVNYPAPEFIKLPVRLKITDLYIHSLAIVAYLEKKLFISFLCDINDDEQLSGRADSVASTTSGLDTRENSRKPSVTEVPAQMPLSSTRERIDIIKNLRIEGEMGSYEPSNFSVNLANVSNGSILRNIGKIEKFLVSALRGMLISELAWPSWIELDFEGDDDEDDNSNSTDTEQDADVVDSDGGDGTGRGSGPGLGSDLDHKESTKGVSVREMKSLQQLQNRLSIRDDTDGIDMDGIASIDESLDYDINDNVSQIDN